MQLFSITTVRDNEGRYYVILPKKDPVPVLGESRRNAVRRYHQNERSLTKKGTWLNFHESVCEYVLLNHAEPVPPSDLKKPPSDTYYLPMHEVFKETSSTTKIRVVFDTSSKSSNGVSLNDMLEPGPSLYPLLTTVINRFRLPLVGLSADISKMFKEIGLQSSERDLHRFLLADEHDQLQDYRMTRLTFGVSSSPFLATRVLLQLANDYEQEYPRAVQIIQHSFYVDDCLMGADSEKESQDLQQEVTNLVSKGRH